jgi:hypothetical protein
MNRDDRGRRDVPQRLGQRLLPALLRTVFGYGLLLWVYVAVNSLTHPVTMSRQLTHFLPWPSEGDTGSACFALSALAFLILRMRAGHDREGARHGG